MNKIAIIACALVLPACETPAPTPAPAPAPAPIVIQQPPSVDPTTGVITKPAGVDVPIEAPKVGPVAFDLRRRDSGGTYKIHVGQRFSVSLVGVPTAGFLWSAPNAPGFLHLVAQTTGPTHTDQLKPGFTGGNHWEVTVFEARKPGTAPLVFEQRRPWEHGGPAADTWTATIVVEP